MVKNNFVIVAFFIGLNFYNIKAMVTPLHNAILKRDEAQCRVMLKDGASPDAKTFAGSTALHLAVQTKSPDIVCLLLNYNPNPLERNESGRTAYDEAVLINHKEIESILSNYQISYFLKKAQEQQSNFFNSRIFISLFEHIHAKTTVKEPVTHETLVYPSTGNIQEPPRATSPSCFTRIPSGPQ